jgi:hypothetical protein
VLLVAAILVVAAGSRAWAQPPALSRVSLDSVGMIDLFAGDATNGRPDASLDISSVVRLSDRWALHIRPWFFKSASADAWNQEIYQAAVRYEQGGRIGLRVDAGYIPSPIGLGMLDMRADINPTIQPHLSYFVPLMPFDRGAPMMRSIASSYPLGALATMSTDRWDARAAVVTSAPTRRFVLGAAQNPRATPVAIVGGGVTPIPGLRLGASTAHGQYATADELSAAVAGDRMLTMWTVEGEYAFGYTKIAGEVTRERFDRGSAQDRAGSWYVQGTHTLSPRWYMSGRYEAIDAPAPFYAPPGSPRLSFRTAEATAAFRMTRELTLRTSVTASRGYAASETDQRVGAQMVWSRRWW